MLILHPRPYPQLILILTLPIPALGHVHLRLGHVHHISYRDPNGSLGHDEPVPFRASPAWKVRSRVLVLGSGEGWYWLISKHRTPPQLPRPTHAPTHPLAHPPLPSTNNPSSVDEDAAIKLREDNHHFNREPITTFARIYRPRFWWCVPHPHAHPHPNYDHNHQHHKNPNSSSNSNSNTYAIPYTGTTNTNFTPWPKLPSSTPTPPPTPRYEIYNMLRRLALTCLSLAFDTLGAATIFVVVVSILTLVIERESQPYINPFLSAFTYCLHWQIVLFILVSLLLDANMTDGIGAIWVSAILMVRACVVPYYSRLPVSPSPHRFSPFPSLRPSLDS